MTEAKRQKWLERLWQAINEGQMPYIEYLQDFWGELCQTSELASYWADNFIDGVKQSWNSKGYDYYHGTVPCLSALFAAKRYQELLTLLEKAPYVDWSYRAWGVKAFVALGAYEEALAYAKNSHGLNTPRTDIAEACEAILLKMNLSEQAYMDYALEANQKSTYLATYRAIVKKYPNKAPRKILHDLIESYPGEEGKWFAEAKEAGFYDLAIELATKSLVDPETLKRAAHEFREKDPKFAIDVGMASLFWILDGYGYEITGIDVIEAFSAVSDAWKFADHSPKVLKANIESLLKEPKPNREYVEKILTRF